MDYVDLFQKNLSVSFQKFQVESGSKNLQKILSISKICKKYQDTPRKRFLTRSSTLARPFSIFHLHPLCGERRDVTQPLQPSIGSVIRPSFIFRPTFSPLCSRLPLNLCSPLCNSGRGGNTGSPGSEAPPTPQWP